MYITFNELRKIKHSLPTGSVKRIADELGIDQQSVRNYFGAMKFNKDVEIVGNHMQPGPEGGIVNLEDTTILDMAKKILEEANIQM
jgi:hypothetical protein